MADENVNNAPGTGGTAGDGTQTTQEPNKLENLPKWAQDLISGVKTELDGYKTKEQQIAAEKEQADKDRLTAEGKHKELADKYEGRVKELEPLVGTVERLTGHVNAGIEAEIKGWPEELKAFDPGKDNLDARMVWVEKARALAAKLTTAQSGKTGQMKPGNAGGPPPAGGGVNGVKDAQDAQKQKMRASGMYSF